MDDDTISIHLSANLSSPTQPASQPARPVYLMPCNNRRDQRQKFRASIVGSLMSRASNKKKAATYSARDVTMIIKLRRHVLLLLLLLPRLFFEFLYDWFSHLSFSLLQHGSFILICGIRHRSNSEISQIR